MVAVAPDQVCRASQDRVLMQSAGHRDLLLQVQNGVRPVVSAMKLL